LSYQQLVEQHHKLTYRDNVAMVAQQMANPLRNAVTIVPGKGDSMRVADLLAAKKYRRAPDRDRTNPDNPTQRSGRWLIRPEMIEDGEVIDKSDMFDMAMNPSSQLMRATVAAVERGFFDCILGVTENAAGVISVGETGILGRAMEGKRGTTVVPLPASQTIAAAATGLTLDKLRTVKKRLRKANFGMEKEDQIYGLITPDQEDNLLGIAAATGANLNTFNVEQLREGKPTRLMGIDWLSTNRLPLNAAGTARMCPFWSKSNIVAGVWQDVEGEMWNDTSKKNLPYIYASACVDAVRVEDGGVFIIECVET
jgi:hypothetical protein